MYKPINTNIFKFIKPVTGSFTAGKYWIIRYPDGPNLNGDSLYCYGYTMDGQFYECPEEYLTIEEAEKAIEKRESIIANGTTVMF